MGNTKFNIQDFKDKVFNMDCVYFLKSLPDNCIDCCITSPPYYNLRNYFAEGQIGQEQTPEEYIARLTDVFMEVYRVLKPDGTLWLNIGDTYNGDKRGNDNPKFKQVNSKDFHKKIYEGAKRKDLLGIPWMLAFSLRSRVWYLRQDIIWAKPNTMPEPVKDRCVKAHEYIFLMSKSEKYHFDYEAIQEPIVDQTRANFTNGRRSNGINTDRNDNDMYERMKHYKPRVSAQKTSKVRNDVGNTYTPRTKNCMDDGQIPNTMHVNRELGLPDKQYVVRNKRDVWHVNTFPDPCAHFAVYPEKLIEPCILAGCPKDGIVLDVFMGSGTTAKVAKRFGRHYTGCELNPEYVKIIDKKLQAVQTELFT